MNSNHFDWVPLEDQPGTHTKLMGVFTERETKLAFFKIGAGAQLKLEGNSFYFILSGDGSAGEVSVAKHTTVHLAPGESGLMSAQTEIQCVQLRLPRP
jgi:hypothetical protein